MHLSLESVAGNLSLEVDSLDTFDVIEAKIKDMGNNLNKWHIIWESSPQIFVRDVTGNTISIRYKCSYTISRLKSKIRSKIGVVPDRQILFFAGKPLEEPFTLSHYNISQGSTLDIAFIFGGGLMRLSVMDTSGMAISVEIYKIYPIGYLKGLIYKQIGKPECQQRLVNVVAGEELLDTNILAFYLIQNGATLRLVDDTLMTSTNEMKVNVKIGPTGKTVQLNVVSSDTINSVKSMIQEKEHIPICQQVLYLPQKRLEDTFTLAHYYILNETTIYLVQIPCEIKYREGIQQDLLQRLISGGKLQLIMKEP